MQEDSQNHADGQKHEEMKGAQAQNAQRGGVGREGPSLNDLIKGANNPEAEKVKNSIDALRLERNKLITKVKEIRRRLNYKEGESVAIDRLLKMEHEKESKQESGKMKRIGYLKRMKNRLEFKISTEATSLSEEKELVRKIGEINKELNEAFTLARMERKFEYVKKDIEEYRANLMAVDKQIAETDEKLDVMYRDLRKLLGIGTSQRRGGKPQARRKVQQQQVQEINLEDIAVIKRKDAKQQKE